MTADITPVAPRSSGSRSSGGRARATTRKAAEKTADKAADKTVDRGDPAAMSPADMVAGPCALPDAPLAMPHQVIEPGRGLLRRMLAGIGLGPHNPAAPPAGTGL